jgi:hypothetical protein
MRNFLHEEERRQFSRVTASGCEREERRGLRTYTVKARLMCDALQRPCDLIVSVPLEILTQFRVQLGHFR